MVRTGRANPTLHRYMLGASEVTARGRAETPAIGHVDGTARPRLVTDQAEPAWSVLEHLRASGAPPVLINTSFNVRGEPIIDTAAGAIHSARAIGLDFLVLGDPFIDF